MSYTLLEGAIALFLLWIAWRIGSLIAPRILRRFREQRQGAKTPQDRQEKPPKIVDI
jgi:hypothetical protein